MSIFQNTGHTWRIQKAQGPWSLVGCSALKNITLAKTRPVKVIASVNMDFDFHQPHNVGPYIVHRLRPKPVFIISDVCWQSAPSPPTQSASESSTGNLCRMHGIFKQVSGLCLHVALRCWDASNFTAAVLGWCQSQVWIKEDGDANHRR